MIPSRETAAEQNPHLGWLVVNLRWVLLLAIGAALVLLDSQLSLAALALLAAAAVAHFVLPLLEYRGVPARLVALAGLALDFVLALGLYALAGANGQRLVWVGVLPALTAALSFGGGVALAVLLAFGLTQAWLTWLRAPGDTEAVIGLLTVAAVLVPGTFLVGILAERLRRVVRQTRLQQEALEDERARVLRQHARAIYEMSSMVSATLNYQDVLEAALNYGTRGAEGQPNATVLVAAVLFFHEDQLHVASGRRLTQADERVVCSGRAGVLGDVIRTGEPIVIDDPAHDPELQQFASFAACHALMALPLRAGYETYGLVLYGHPREGFFDEDQRALLAAVANQAIIALQNAQLYRNLREEKRRLLEVQEEAQKKLARDLHDGPTQAIAALAMRANFIRRLIDRDPKTAGDELYKMEELARRTTKEIRHMLFTLRPLVLESHGLTAALKQLAEKMKDTHNQMVIVEPEPGVDTRLELGQQGVIFYIVEEAVNNARKHAQAEHIWVRLKIQGEMLLIEIQDDGVGFNVGAVDSSYERRGSLGMVNMRERAEMLGGAVRVDSAENRGTRVAVYIPLREPAAEPARA